MLVELASCTAREANCGSGVAEATSILVSDAGGSTDGSRAATVASGNSDETAQGTGTVNSDKVTAEPTAVTVEGKAKRTNRETAKYAWTSLLVHSVFVSDCSSSE